MFGLGVELVYPLVACAFALAAAGTDIKNRKIPNWLTGSAFLTGVAFHAVLGGWQDVLLAVAAGLAAGCIFLLFYLAGGMGAGDVKLVASLGVIVGIPNVAYLLLFTSLAGGAFALLLAFRHGRVRETICNMGRLVTHHVHEGLSPHSELNIKNSATLRLPYAVPIACGALLMLYFREVSG